MKAEDATYNPTCDCAEPKPQKSQTKKNSKKLTIGLVGNNPDSDETRSLLTPEICGILVSSGFTVLMERNAAVDINFTDENYENYGVKIVSRIEALKAETVVSYELMREKDMHHLTPESTVLCMNVESVYDPKVMDVLLAKRITVGCLERMYSHNEEFVFANLIDEIDGRTAIMYAQEALSFLGGGKGVLLGGISGILPCEVLLIGEGRKIYNAARSALNLGAEVTLMDNDISALHLGRVICGRNLVTSALHPKVLCNKVQSADVIILDKCTRDFTIPSNLKAMVKENVYILDFRQMQPSICVPRTVAMALSNCMSNFFAEMQLKNGFIGMMSTNPGVQAGILTFGGHITNKLLGAVLSRPSTEIGIILGSPTN